MRPTLKMLEDRVGLGRLATTYQHAVHGNLDENAGDFTAVEALLELIWDQETSDAFQLNCELFQKCPAYLVAAECGSRIDDFGSALLEPFWAWVRDALQGDRHRVVMVQVLEGHFIGDMHPSRQIPNDIRIQHLGL